MRSVQEFLEHFTDSPTGTTHNSKPEGTKYALCLQFYCTKFYTANKNSSLRVFSDLFDRGQCTL